MIEWHQFDFPQVDWLVFTLPFSENMELNDANLQTLTEFLRKTLDPDPAVRRPGTRRKYSF